MSFPGSFCRRNVPNLHDARRILVGERSQQHGVHHGENRGVGADTQCEEEDSRSREAWITSENPEAMAQIRDQVTMSSHPMAARNLGIGGSLNTNEQSGPNVSRNIAQEGVSTVDMADEIAAFE